MTTENSGSEYLTPFASTASTNAVNDPFAARPNEPTATNASAPHYADPSRSSGYVCSLATLLPPQPGMVVVYAYRQGLYIQTHHADRDIIEYQKSCHDLANAVRKSHIGIVEEVKWNVQDLTRRPAAKGTFEEGKGKV